MARIIVSEAIRATRLYGVGTSDAVMGAARGCVEAAYEIDRPTGESVRVALLALVGAPLNLLAPPIRRSVSRAISDLTDELSAPAPILARRRSVAGRQAIDESRGNRFGGGPGLLHLAGFFPSYRPVRIGILCFSRPRHGARNRDRSVHFLLPQRGAVSFPTR